ncbi:MULTISPECIES: hypothetical protein [Pseudomonas]|uniref:Uncharacterized protein n=1 Tax=Phytopseudomonas flavescens TaxID=29435 RepID=A0A7Z0BSP8_9GAMM|nr:MULTISPECIES: hypothetical protein [Pseudomonas]MCW2294477.1 hypothetical protein [Pseudomonas sp. BIGb0408]NYH76249.1 hypothetical protein [Pseudomonas flavescens]
MISAPIAKAIDFPSQRQAQRPARRNAWLARIGQRLQRRQQADAACPIH